MRSLLLPILTLLLASDAYAITCPASITCNYQNGTCSNTEGFSYAPAYSMQPFSGDEEFVLTSIIGFKSGNLDQYHMNCTYYYNNNDLDMIVLGPISPNPITKLTGNGWEFYGWGNWYAKCPDISNPSNCSAE